MMKRNLAVVVAALAILFASRPALAHFPWLAIDDGKAVYFFGEHTANRTYKLPASIAKAEINLIDKDGNRKTIEVQSVENDDFVGLSSTETVPAKATLISKVTYGLFRGARLDYYTVYQGGPLPKSRDAYENSPVAQLDLNAQLVDTDSGVDVFVTWKGKPLPGVQVQLYCDDGHEEGVAKTDESGKVSFTDREVEDGLNGIMLGHTVKGDSGEINGEAYEATSHYLTVTFVDPQDFESKSESKKD